MKKIILFALVMALSLPVSLNAQSKRAARVEYVLTNLGIDAAKQKALKPLLTKYLEAKKSQTAAYEDMKDDLKEKIDAGKISDKQAANLMKAKWEADQRELNLKKEYEPKFTAVVGAAKTYKAFDLLNDKKSKFMNEKK